jgi:hypothetical protein
LERRRKKTDSEQTSDRHHHALQLDWVQIEPSPHLDIRKISEKDILSYFCFSPSLPIFFSLGGLFGGGIE